MEIEKHMVFNKFCLMKILTHAVVLDDHRLFADSFALLLQRFGAFDAVSSFSKWMNLSISSDPLVIKNSMFFWIITYQRRMDFPY